MVPYSWIVGSQTQAKLQSSAKKPTANSGFLVFLAKEECGIKEKLYFFPGIEYGNSIDVLATSSNTVLMSEEALLLHRHQPQGEPGEHGYIGSK